MYYTEKNGKSLVHFRKNEYVYRESDYCHFVYFLVEGSVQIYKNHFEKSNRITFRLIKNENYFGLFDLFTENQLRIRSATVTSKTAIVQRISVRDFSSQLIRRNEFYKEMMFGLKAYHNQLWDRIVAYGQYDIFKMIGWTLLELGVAVDHSEEILKISDYTHMLLAEYTGTCRQTITTYLNAYRKKGIIEYNRNQILINKTLMLQLIES